MKSVGRLATYLQGLRRPPGPDQRVGPAVLERFRTIHGGRLSRGIDAHATTAQLEHIAPSYPRSGWPPVPPARRAVRRAPSGSNWPWACDGVILHGATPAELEPIIEAYAG